MSAKIMLGFSRVLEGCVELSGQNRSWRRRAASRGEAVVASKDEEEVCTYVRDMTHDMRAK